MQGHRRRLIVGKINISGLTLKDKGLVMKEGQNYNNNNVKQLNNACRMPITILHV